MKNERVIGKHLALGAPYGKIEPSSASAWPCPGEQAVPDNIYYPAALELERAATHTARVRAAVSDDLRKAERRARRVYQVLAFLGWAAVVVMGFWG